MSKHVAKIDFDHELDETIKQYYYTAHCHKCRGAICGSSTGEDTVIEFAKKHLRKCPDHTVTVGRIMRLTWEDGWEDLT